MKFLRYAFLIMLCAALMLSLSACGDDDDGSYSVYVYNPGGNFVTNINESNFLLRSDVIFRLTDQKAAETFAADNDIIRDAVIKVLRELTEEEARNGNAEFLDAVAQRIVDSANEAMNTDVFYSASFNDFVVTR